MITSLSKSESNNNTNSNIKSNLQFSSNNVITDYSALKIPLTNKLVIETDNLEENNNNFFPIHNAIISDNLEQLENLLKIGENPDILNKSGETPLYLSVDIENYDAMIILLEFGADSNIQKEDGNTPLHLATEKKLDIYISSLLSHGANPNILNKNFQSPLHIGIIKQVNDYILNKFKENNGDIYNIKDKFNKTPFDYSKDDEEYKNLIINIFEQNNLNNNKNKSLNENNENNSNSKYYDFVSLSRNIQITTEDNNEINNNNIKSKEKENNKSEKSNINNHLRKHLLFSSTSNEISIEQKPNKLIYSGTSNASVIDQNKKIIQNNIGSSIINILSDKGSNNSNITNNIINNNTNIVNKNNHNLTEENTKIIKTLNLSGKISTINNCEDEHNNYNLTSPDYEKNILISKSLNLYKKRKFEIKIKNLNHLKTLNTNIIYNANSNINNTNGNISNKGISELNPLDLINQMASSNNSNIFSELQNNTNTNKDEEISESKNRKTEEDFYNEGNNKLTINDDINFMKENLSGNFSLNINEINYINSMNDSLEYSKSKSFINNESFGNNKKDNSEKDKIINDEININIFNNDNNNDIDNINNDNIQNANYKNIERYKSTSSNNSRSKADYDIDSVHSNEKSSNNSNKKTTHHYRQLSYHNKQTSNNKNKAYNNSINSNYTNNSNKENIEPNNNINDINEKDKIDNIIKNENDNNINNNVDNNAQKYIVNSNIEEIIINKGNESEQNLSSQEMKKKPLPIYTKVVKQKIFRNNNMLPKSAREQKTKDSTMEYFRTNEKINSEENIFFINDDSNYIYNFDGNTNILDITGNNQFNTFNSENNSFKLIGGDSYRQNQFFRKTFKKKYFKKKLSNSAQFGQMNNYNTNFNDLQNKIIFNSYNNNIIISPQQISNDVVSKLREWLISCDLLCYYNLLIKNNIYDIDSYISNLRKNRINISYKDIENFGIKKPGHIFRFLLRIQMDLGVLDGKICNYIMCKFNDNILSNIGVNETFNEIKYCGLILCPGSIDFNKNSNYYDIFSFLRNKDLLEFKENFIHNGFDQIEFILIQLFSSYAFNKEILNNYMHIYSENDKIKIIKKLYEEKEIILNEIGLEYNENEVNGIIYENINETDNSNKLKNDNLCNIF